MTPDATTKPGSPGTHVKPLEREHVRHLEEVVGLAGISGLTLRNRLSVVFVYPGMGVGDVYPELAGCTTEVCAFIEEAAVFEQHGIQVIGLSTEVSNPPPGCLTIPFPTGVLPQDGIGDPIEFVDKPDKRYAVRASFVIGPDGDGMMVTDIEDVVEHARQCFHLAMEIRLDRYRQATLEHLRSGADGVRPDVVLQGLLPNGADSVAIPRVDVTFRLVTKLADRAIISQEAGYIQHVNRLLVEHGHPRIFPTVLAISDAEDPAWYLMEAADPTKLDDIVFADEARTVLSDPGRDMVNAAVDKLCVLYELTREEKTPTVARYHYLDRFVELPKRRDFNDTFSLLVGGDVDEVLSKPIVIDGEHELASYRDQTEHLSANVQRLVQPVGSLLHGDAHLPNMLLSTDGSDVWFIDPRVVWDGNDVGEPGFGDPLYDLGTLLHSLHVMSAILHAIETDRTDDLVGVSNEKMAISIDAGTLQLVDNPSVAAFMQYADDRFPTTLLGPDWQARLHINAANALIGWLKYPRAIQTGSAWWSVFASGLHHLEQARRYLEGSTT